MNIELLHEVQQHILAEPVRFNMNDWWYVGMSAPFEDLKIPERRDKFARNPSCHTTACIAGWALALRPDFEFISVNQIDPDYINSDSVETTAATLLGITTEAATRLFHCEKWPANYAVAFYNTSNPPSKAKIACERIDHFIATNGAE